MLMLSGALGPAEVVALEKVPHSFRSERAKQTKTADPLGLFHITPGIIFVLTHLVVLCEQICRPVQVCVRFSACRGIAKRRLEILRARILQ